MPGKGVRNDCKQSRLTFFKGMFVHTVASVIAQIEINDIWQERKFIHLHYVKKRSIYKFFLHFL